jgi:hypothetical protein
MPAKAWRRVQMGRDSLGMVFIEELLDVFEMTFKQ